MVSRCSFPSQSHDWKASRRNWKVQERHWKSKQFCERPEGEEKTEAERVRAGQHEETDDEANVRSSTWALRRITDSSVQVPRERQMVWNERITEIIEESAERERRAPPSAWFERDSDSISWWTTVIRCRNSTVWWWSCLLRICSQFRERCQSATALEILLWWSKERLEKWWHIWNMPYCI